MRRTRRDVSCAQCSLLRRWPPSCRLAVADPSLDRVSRLSGRGSRENGAHRPREEASGTWFPDPLPASSRGCVHFPAVLCGKKVKSQPAAFPFLISCCLLVPVLCLGMAGQVEAASPPPSPPQSPRASKEKKEQSGDAELQPESVSGGGDMHAAEPFDSVSVDRVQLRTRSPLPSSYNFDDEGSREQGDGVSLGSTEFLPDKVLKRAENPLCRDWRVPHAFLSGKAAGESLEVPDKLKATASLMPFYFYGLDNRDNYLILTKFSDFDIPVIRSQLTDLDIRRFFRFKNLAWFGRLTPSPTSSSVVVSDAAGFDIAHAVFHGGLSVAKTYVQAMTSTIPDVGVRVSEIHIINVPRAAGVILDLVQRLSPSEIKFFTYPSLQEFLDKVGDVIGRNRLPRCFGGTNPMSVKHSELESCFDDFVKQVKEEKARRAGSPETANDFEKLMESRFHRLFD